MEMLKTHATQIVTASGKPTVLRGVNIGWWMNMEDFIDGYPGSEHRLRAVMAETLGREKAKFLFERWMDHFFNEGDVAYLKKLNVNVLRLPFNYRHFEQDSDPFDYDEKGFKRLETAVEWCSKKDIYAILDFHAVPGWQSADWHCDNANRLVRFWYEKHYQDRYVNLWAEIARRFSDNPAIAGYDLINEPCTTVKYLEQDFLPHWDEMNAVYHRTIDTIRANDPNHIIFLEGDDWSSDFSGLDDFGNNIVCSSHHYIPATIGPGKYPGMIQGEFWDSDTIRAEFEHHGGFIYSREHNIPLLAGEFGPVYTGPTDEIEDRLRAVADQINIFEQHGVSWAMWTYKDIGEMGWVQMKHDAPYRRAVQPVLEAKRELSKQTKRENGKIPAGALTHMLKEEVNNVLKHQGFDYEVDEENFSMFIAFPLLAHLLQQPFADCFRNLSEKEIDGIMESFELSNCIPHPILEKVLNRFVGFRQ